MNCVEQGIQSAHIYLGKKNRYRLLWKKVFKNWRSRCKEIEFGLKHSSILFLQYLTYKIRNVNNRTRCFLCDIRYIIEPKAQHFSIISFSCRSKIDEKTWIYIEKQCCFTFKENGRSYIILLHNYYRYHPRFFTSVY